MQVEVNGTRLWYDVDGPVLVPDEATMRERPTVVLLHGGPGSYDHSYFKPEFARLSQLAQVVYVDLRGHGRSDWGDPDAWSFELCADDVRSFCDSLGIVRPVVLGHSLGGFVAMLYGARHPGHAGALILQSTMARFDLARIVEEFRRAGGDQVAEIAERAYGGESSSVSDEEWARCFILFGPWVPGEREQARKIINPALRPAGLELLRRFDVVDQLPRVESPTLVCVGDLDPVTPVAAAREIVHALPTAVAHLELIKGAGHFAWMDAPDTYWRVVTDFVLTASGRSEAAE
jgi:pimeloyl-ACP methyl ester carboxylesterase